MVRLDSLCVCVQVVCVCLDGFVHWFLTGLGAGWSGMVRCCSLSVSCDSSSVIVDCGLLDFNL